MEHALPSSPSNEVVTELRAVSEPHGFLPGEPGYAEFELGTQVLADAQQLDESEPSRGSAFFLFREALLLFLKARLARDSTASSPRAAGGEGDGRARGEERFETDELWARLERLPELEPVIADLTTAQVGWLRATLARNWAEPYAADWAPETRRRCHDALRPLVFALGAPLASAAGLVRRRVFARRLKIAALAVCLLAPATYALLRRPNLALHRPVTVSSRSPEHGVEPSRVVDGKRTNLGFHTRDEGTKSVTVDLGAVRRIRRVDVFNRADCCGERAVPLTLELGSDGKSFRKTLVRIDPFSLWKAEFAPIDARYVRLTQSGKGPFHLSEIEVF